MSYPFDRVLVAIFYLRWRVLGLSLSHHVMLPNLSSSSLDDAVVRCVLRRLFDVCDDANVIMQDNVGHIINEK